MPLNAQMKDVDLILMNMKNKKVLSIQVKWSKAFEPSANSIKKYGDGSTGRFFIDKDIIHRSTADYFVFLVYVIHEKTKMGRRVIEPHTIIIPVKKLKELCLKYKTPHPNNYSFYFRINPKKKTARDVREKGEKNHYDVSKYLDELGIKNMNGYLK